VAWGYFLYAHAKSGELPERDFWITEKDTWKDPVTGKTIRKKVISAEFEFELRMMEVVRALADNIIRLKFEERQLKLAESQSRQIAKVISGALAELGYNTSDSDVRAVVRRHMLAIESTATPVTNGNH
jgi:hypothetical protein